MAGEYFMPVWICFGDFYRPFFSVNLRVEVVVLLLGDIHYCPS